VGGRDEGKGGEEEIDEEVRVAVDRCMSDIWLTGNAELFSQLFYFISSENVSGKLNLPCLNQRLTHFNYPNMIIFVFFIVDA